ncbi:MAG TPA: hypothetical protein VHG91_06875, partial [Longimicrobium sp.]|nr:hypothetical protein [Longimicrobium sp.]
APAPARPEARTRTRQGGLVDRKTRRRRWMRWGVIGLAAALIAASVWIAVRALGRGDDVAPPLSEADAAHLDSLTLASYERIERGAALLELGLADEALREFARGLTVLETSRLAGNRYARPRIATLEAAIAAVYREKRVAVPARWRAAPAAAPAASPAPRGSISAAEFAAGVKAVQAEFQARYGRTITVTGGDHAEHVSLYGRGGALDLRVRDLSREQIAFAVQAFRARGIRVKDFSDDDVLQRQIASAKAAGLLDRASTGLHLHIDRFANRRDRWTVQ